MRTCGLDVHKDTIFRAIYDGKESVVRKFDTFTPSIREMCGYISSQGVEAVGMESTGIYIDPIRTVLRQSGMRSVVARKLLVTIYAILLKRQEYRPDVADKDSDDRMIMRRLQYHIAQCQKLQRFAPKPNDEPDPKQNTTDAKRPGTFVADPVPLERGDSVCK